MTQTTPKFRKVSHHNGPAYLADTTRRYAISRDSEGNWYLGIHEINMVAGIPTTGREIERPQYCDTKRDAVEFATIYESLGDDYSPAEHGHRSRTTEVACILFDRIMAEVES